MPIYWLSARAGIASGAAVFPGSHDTQADQAASDDHLKSC